MRVKYTFATRDTVEVEVDEKTYNEIKELDRKEYNSNKKETRRHCSADAHYENFGFEIADEKDLFAEYFSHELWERLLQPLNAKQRKLIYKRFVEKQKPKDIAKAENVSVSAIQNRFERIFARIKKFVDLTDFGGGKC
jgi:DNA-directed RNA polymerase specialized sigma24 family protein